MCLVTSSLGFPEASIFAVRGLAKADSIVQGLFEEMMSGLDFLSGPLEDVSDGQLERLDTSIITCGRARLSEFQYGAKLGKKSKIGIL